MKLGDTFVNLNPGSPEHLWVIVSDPGPGGEVVIFNLTSHREGCDESCVINRGEHSFVHHSTVVAYERGQLLPVAALPLMEARKLFEPRESVSSDLLKRIQHGALASDRTPQKLLPLIDATLRRLDSDST